MDTHTHIQVIGPSDLHCAPLSLSTLAPKMSHAKTNGDGGGGGDIYYDDMINGDEQSIENASPEKRAIFYKKRYRKCSTRLLFCVVNSIRVANPI